MTVLFLQLYIPKTSLKPVIQVNENSTVISVGVHMFLCVCTVCVCVCDLACRYMFYIPHCTCFSECTSLDSHECTCMCVCSSWILSELVVCWLTTVWVLICLGSHPTWTLTQTSLGSSACLKSNPFMWSTFLSCRHNSILWHKQWGNARRAVSCYITRYSHGQELD